jgi:hypothetical protein
MFDYSDQIGTVQLQYHDKHLIHVLNCRYLSSKLKFYSSSIEKLKTNGRLLPNEVTQFTYSLLSNVTTQVCWSQLISNEHMPYIFISVEDLIYLSV